MKNKMYTAIVTTSLAFSTVVMSEQIIAESYSNYDERFSQAYNDCAQEAETLGTFDRVRCANDENQRQDKRLNENYRKIMQKASQADQKLLRAAQRQWIKYRDADFELHTLYRGTDMQVFAAVRRAAQTAQRANELEILLER